MTMILKAEFPKKTNSKRRKIFKERICPLVEELIREFYEQQDLRIPDSQVRELTHGIVNDFIAAMRQPEFGSSILDPDALSNDEDILKTIIRAVSRTAQDEQPFDFLKRDASVQQNNVPVRTRQAEAKAVGYEG